MKTVGFFYYILLDVLNNIVFLNFCGIFIDINRIVVNKPKTTECKLCKNNFSLYALPSHLKHKHHMNSDDYVNIYGEFRKIKTKSKRKINKIICKICNKEFSSVGISTHLRDSHHLKIENYVKTYGEFRLKYLKKINNNDCNLKCMECNDENQ